MSYTLTLQVKSFTHGKVVSEYINRMLGQKCEARPWLEGRDPENKLPTVTVDFGGAFGLLDHKFLWAMLSYYANEFGTDWFYDEEKIEVKDYVLHMISFPFRSILGKIYGYIVNLFLDENEKQINFLFQKYKKIVQDLRSEK